MKKGDLVNFFSTIALYQKDYAKRNPGLVIAAEHRRMTYDSDDLPFRCGESSAYVLWNTGEITCEHSTYLKIIK